MRTRGGGQRKAYAQWKTLVWRKLYDNPNVVLSKEVSNFLGVRNRIKYLIYTYMLNTRTRRHNAVDGDRLKSIVMKYRLSERRRAGT